MAMLSFGGIDVSKDRLDVMVLPEEQCSSVSNDPAGWAELVEQLRGFSISAIGIEASGGYERGVMRALLAAGMSVRQVNPFKLRQFARASGVLAKNDPLDARMIASFVADTGRGKKRFVFLGSAGGGNRSIKVRSPPCSWASCDPLLAYNPFRRRRATDADRRFAMSWLAAQFAPVTAGKAASRAPMAPIRHASSAARQHQHHHCACGGGCPRCASSGRPLDTTLRRSMEARLHTPLSDVRVHADDAAAEAAGAERANAFTVGSDIWFGEGRYAPHTDSWLPTIGHEVVHVVQQRGGGAAGAPHDAEAEAHALAAPLAAGAPVHVKHLAPLGVQRDAAGASPPMTPSEQLVQSTFGDAGVQAVRQYQSKAAELAAVHRVYLATHQIPATWTSFAIIEIKEGRLMTRAERYEAMLKKQGKDQPVMNDLFIDARDPEYVTKEEFHDEFLARHRAEWDQCEEEHTFNKYIFRCHREVDEKYGGEEFKSWKRSYDADLLRQNAPIVAKMGAVIEGGAFATAGRAAGGLVGWARGGDPLKDSETGAAIGGLFDTTLLVWAGSKARGRVAEMPPSPPPSEPAVGDWISTSAVPGPQQVEAVLGDTTVLTPAIKPTQPGRALPAAGESRQPSQPAPMMSAPLSPRSALPPGSVFPGPRPAAPATSRGHELDMSGRLAAAQAVETTKRNIADQQAWLRANQPPAPTEPAEVQRPKMPPELAKAVRNLPPLSQPDERVAGLKGLLERPGLEPEEAEYLRALERKAEAESQKEAVDAVGKALATLATTLAREQETLRQASLTVKQLIEARGPNYKAKISRTPYDEVMGKEAYDKLPSRQQLVPITCIHCIRSRTRRR